jgi:hypothetical protein
VLTTAALLAALAVGADRADDEPDPKPRVVLPDESAYSPSPRDGKGTATVSPVTVGASEPVTLTFTYTAAGEGIAVGGGVVVMVSRFWGWTAPQDVNPEAPAYVTVRCSDQRVSLDSFVDRGNGSLVAVVEGHVLEAGQSITFVYGDTSGGLRPGARGLADRYAERGERFFVKVDGDGDGFFTPIARQPTFRVESGPAYRPVLLGPSRVRSGRPFELHLSVLDRSNNLVESFEGKLALGVLVGQAEFPAEVVFAAADRGSKRIRVQAKAPGLLRMAVSDPGGGLVEAQSNPMIVSDAGQERYKLYWADLHGHSNNSDGTATPAEWFRYAREVARLDVAALTDHDHWGYTLLDEDEAAWKNIVETASSFNEPGSFVTFLGYEWTNWTYGHKHVLYSKQSEARVISAFDEKTDQPDELWAALGSRDCITINHHPGGGPVPTFWKYYNPHFEPVVEITSVHGVSEAMGHPQCIYRPVESGMVQSALARGYRLGIIGSGDTHDGHPGMRALGGGTSGLAGIYATELTREAIFEALRARRVFATTGCRAVLRFHLEEVPMGGVAVLESPREERKLSISVLGDAPIARMTVVKNNQPVASRPGESLLENWEWLDTQPAEDGDYYYVRIEQADGQWIWSSPIWVELKSR